MIAYYNEIDPYAVEWLRNLIAAGHIADGVVDDRSIIDVEPSDLSDFDQCHFFAGLGGWSRALRLAGWPDSRPVWTGSPPCQPFSVAGKQRGKDDERHLAPHWLELVSECRPANIFGEQVTGAIRHGWFDDLQAHLEREGYACGMVVLPACGVGAPHIRQRQWIVAERVADTLPAGWAERRPGSGNGQAAGSGAAGGLGNALGPRLEGYPGHGDGSCEPGRQQTQPDGSVAEAGTACRFCGYPFDQDALGKYGCPNCCGEGLDSGLDNTLHRRHDPAQEEVRAGRGGAVLSGRQGSGSPPDSFWRAADWLYCRDGKWRPVEPGTFPLAHGVAARVGRLRAYGNAIVPPVAAEVIRAYMEGE